MIFKINPLLFDYMRFVPNNRFRKNDKFTVIEDGVAYSLNPDTDSIIYENTEIKLKEFQEALNKCKNYLSENYKEWMEISSDQFKVSFYEIDGQATAFHGEFENNKSPKEIKMCLSYFLNLHNFKFVLAHEVGHYEEVITKKSKNSFFNDFSVLLISTILIAFCSILSFVYLSQFKGRLPEIMIVFDFAFVFLSLTYYGLYVASTFCSTIASHFAEYEADAFALRMFPECDTSYFKPNWRYSDTHPANNFRIMALKKGIRIYIGVVPPWCLKYCDSYQDYKDTFKGMLKELPYAPLYMLKSFISLITEIFNKLKPKKISTNLKGKQS